MEGEEAIIKGKRQKHAMKCAKLYFMGKSVIPNSKSQIPK